MVVVFVPKETSPFEKRVAATPETVKSLAKQGVEVLVETSAGAAAGMSDADFVTVGARIVANAKDGYGTADIVLKVRPPNDDGEVAALKPGTILISSLQPTTRLPLVRSLAEAKVTTFALDLMPRITRAQKMDILSSQATVAGHQAVLLAACALPKMFPLMMTAAGTLTPARVFVMGAGVAGLQAIATAKRLGAIVEATDVRAAAREQVESLGAKFVDTTGGQTAEGQGGYAKEQGEDALKRQRDTLKALLAGVDVVVTTALIPGRKAPVLVTADMVAGMRAGSVLVDLAVESGGNVEGSVAGETVVVNGVSIIGEPNLPAMKAADASRMFARNVLGFLELIVTKKGELTPKWDDECVAGTLVTRDGEIRHAASAQQLSAKGAS